MVGSTIFISLIFIAVYCIEKDAQVLISRDFFFRQVIAQNHSETLKNFSKTSLE